MSKTSMKERNKAIRKAWEKEQVLVQEGKGTRDWTMDQQADILDPNKGKAYDDQGRAFVGQHMKSAAKYPEYQGDPDNIQFLTYDEHLEAHKGSWQNPTNWYYDPITKEYTDFGDNAPTPCSIIELSDPFVRASEPIYKPSETSDASQNEGKATNSGDAKGKDTTSPKPSKAIPSEDKASQKVSKSFGERIMDAVDAIKGFSERHPVLTGIIKFAGVAAVAAGADAIANGGKGSGGSSGSSSSTDYLSSSSDNDYLDGDDYDDSSDDRDYPEERSSPKEHMVPGHGQHYHTKDGVIWKEKDAYPRGGKHNDE